MYFSLDGIFYEVMECYTFDNYPDRPKISPVCKNDRYYRYLRTEIHEWMICYDIKYDLGHECIGNIDYWFLEIPNDCESMFFKLTWL